MKYVTFLLSLIFVITFMGCDKTEKSKIETKLKTETAESVNKDCKNHKCSEGKECPKDSSCKHKCDKDDEKCENGKMCKCKRECKKDDDKAVEHKCGEGKCGEGKCGGDTENK